MSNELKLNKIKRLLGLEVKLEQISLENGAVLEAEVFEPGYPVFVVAEDERIPVPVGQYELPDGNVLVVEEEGIIASFGPAAEEEAPAEEEVEMEEKETPKKVIESVVKETQFSDQEIERLADLVFAKLESKLSSYTIEAGEMETEELEAKLSEETKVEEVKVEMEEIKPAKHNPEAKQENLRKPINNKKPQTLRDRVLSKLSN